jgi:amino acid permease
VLTLTRHLQPWLSIWGLSWCIFFIIINGFAVFWDFTAAGFLTACASPHCSVKSHNPNFLTDINIPLFFGLYFGWKYVKKTEIWKPEEMDFVTVSVMATSLRPDLTREVRVFLRRRRQRGHTTRL